MSKIITKEEYLKKVKTLTIARNLSPRSIKAYHDMAEKFLNWCENNHFKPKNISYDNLQEYVVYLLTIAKLSPKSANSHISFVRSFFVYILRRPIDRYTLPSCKVDTKPREILSKNEVVKFINALPTIKAKAIVTLLYSCGLRVSEATNLKYSDIPRERMTVKIESSKNRAGRYVPLSKEALNILTEYWRLSGKPRNYLFPGAKPNTHITTPTVSEYIRKAKKTLNWDSRQITTHTFRHCIGTHMYESGIDLLTIQKFLGHKSIASTTVYITFTNNSKLFVNPFDTVGGGVSIG